MKVIPAKLNQTEKDLLYQINKEYDEYANGYMFKIFEKEKIEIINKLECLKLISTRTNKFNDEIKYANPILDENNNKIK